MIHAHAGAYVGAWPGLKIYRFTQPTLARWDELESLSVVIVGHTGTSLTAVGQHRLPGRFHYAIVSGRGDFDCHQLLQASPAQPAICVILQIDPLVVRTVSARMRAGGMALKGPDNVSPDCESSTVDDELMAVMARFLGSLAVGCDRRVLAPLHLQELVYRMLQGEQSDRLLLLATNQAKDNPVAAALDYIADHLAEPITIEIMAAQVNLSTSAFSRVFRNFTGRSPYQHLKRARLNRARQLLDEGRLGVANVARSVGYTSVSHFIKVFRSRFGVTPGDYVGAQMFRGDVRAIHHRLSSNPHEWGEPSVGRSSDFERLVEQTG